MPQADGTGYALARVIREAFKGKQSLTLIDSFAEPASKGDVSVRPLGAVLGGDETVVPGSGFALLEEQVGVRCCFATSDDDADPISMVSIAADVRRAVLKAGYSNNINLDFDAVAQYQAGEKLTYIGGVTVTAQSQANLS